MHEELDFKTENGTKNTHDIQVYALSTCGFCKRALEFLRTNELTFRYIYVDLLDGDLRKKVKHDLTEHFDENIGFPFAIIDFGKKILVGFAERKWIETLL